MGTKRDIKYKMYHDNQREWKRIASQVSTGTAVQSPFTFYCVKNNDWSLSHNWDYWNINFTNASGVDNTEISKTIYDPSVSGFCLLRTAAFTGFTTTGGNTNVLSQFNVSGSWNHGWNFLTGLQNNGTIFIEALGYKGNATGGILIGVGSEAPLWTSGACSVVNSRALGLNHNDVFTQHMDFRTNAFPVRCDLE